MYAAIATISIIKKLQFLHRLHLLKCFFQFNTISFAHQHSFRLSYSIQIMFLLSNLSSSNRPKVIFWDIWGHFAQLVLNNHLSILFLEMNHLLCTVLFCVCIACVWRFYGVLM